MSILDDVGAIRARMLAIQVEERRLHPGDAADYVAGEVRRALDPLVGQPNNEATRARAVGALMVQLPVTIWGNTRPDEGVMHLSAEEFAQALQDARDMGHPVIGVRQIHPAPSREAFEAAFPGVSWPGPHRHVQLYT